MKNRWKVLLTACVTALCIAVFAGCGNGGTQQPVDEYGELCIEDVTVYVNSDKTTTFAEIAPVFTKPEKAEQLEYTYDTAEIKIENNIVTPIKRADKTVNVRAKSEHFNTVFKVEVEYIRFTGSDASPLYDIAKYPVNERAVTCEALTESTTLLIGDSFTDDYFIGEYMRNNMTGKQIMNAGISSTTSYHWEAAYKTVIGDTAPKNIVFHVGTNNFYDAHDDVEETTDSLKRLFMFVHCSYPASNIYWFNITQRTDTRYASQVTETNAALANWCSKYDWITCVDTCSKVKPAMLRDDGVHPLTDSYKTFTDALVAAGCQIENK